MHYDGTFNLFCSTTCQYIHIITHRRIIPCVWCKVKKYNFDLIHRTGLFGEVIYGCSLNCLNQLSVALRKISNKSTICEHCSAEAVVCEITTQTGELKSFCSTNCVAEYQSKLRKKESRNELETLPQISSVCSLADAANEKKVIFIEEEMPPEISNKMCQVTTMTREQGTQLSKEKVEQEAQTDFEEELRLRAVPVPIFVPQPFHMWNVPLPRAVPFPLIVPLPMLVPLTRDSSTEYLKTMKREPVKTPRDPYEQELLMMAELVASEKTKEEVDEGDEQVEDFSPEQGDGAFSDDMLQMALKMATDYQDTAVDLEGALQANTITPGHHPMELTSSDEIVHTEPLTGAIRGAISSRGRGRGRGSRGPRGSTPARRARGRPPVMHSVPVPVVSPPPPPEPVEKPDAHMCLKYTFGVNAWKQWVTTKNADLERSSRKLKLFKNDLLQMTADELNYSLCLFVNEVRKPNGTEYAPDTIYYLCLGIQQYLYECGRIDNIFCDSFYEKFTDCLDDVCGKFSTLYSDSHYIVTRVEEEHLWESKQLGAHSPFVLLTTLMFFNTKHFNLTSVEEHMQLSFSHIMKHWKRNPGQGGSRQMAAGGRNVLLRFYPPQNAQANTRKKKVYEQQENEENPLRCPVKLYEFYLSKCPESVKTRNDVFYLLPERSCVPESPVWYSTMALDLRALNKMLHRVKMVKEINVALLTH